MEMHGDSTTYKHVQSQTPAGERNSRYLNGSDASSPIILYIYVYHPRRRVSSTCYNSEIRASQSPAQIHTHRSGLLSSSSSLHLHPSAITKISTFSTQTLQSQFKYSHTIQITQYSSPFSHLSSATTSSPTKPFVPHISPKLRVPTSLIPAAPIHLTHNHTLLSHTRLRELQTAH
ncbi:hypothetical protein BDY19DRAFT_956876 [Irpex rosettiformis]|uniref:Uncharacterized protein n=1 Tax=Irpex rosettiformis TaxID=378272 RepID=A0ACB8TYY9_9APHY|nr:hypothetical protein BDY19DRAFT_956876 [Irpex rosettiformis]